MQVGTKISTNGTEHVLLRKLVQFDKGITACYPIVDTRASKSYIVSLLPAWHSRLLPDSILRTEDASIIRDVSHTNSIHKVYLAAMRGVENLKPGDTIVIYRPANQGESTWYKSVATSIGSVEEYRHISTFASKDDFLGYCRPYSIFSEKELNDFWVDRRYPHIFRFTYNIALRKRPTRQVLVQEIGLPHEAYWGFMPISNEQLLHIAKKGCIDESLIVH